MGEGRENRDLTKKTEISLNEDTVKILLRANEGFSSSSQVIKALNLSHESYYTNKRTLMQVGYISRQHYLDGYGLTVQGETWLQKAITHNDPMVLSLISSIPAKKPSQPSTTVTLQEAVRWKGRVNIQTIQDIPYSFRVLAYFPKEGETIEFFGIPPNQLWPKPVNEYKKIASPFSLGMTIIFGRGRDHHGEVEMILENWGYLLDARGFARYKGTDEKKINIELYMANTYKLGPRNRRIFLDTCDYSVNDPIKFTLAFY